MTTATKKQMEKRKNNNDLTLRDRVSRLEGGQRIIILLDVGTFMAIMGLVLAQAFA